MGDPSGWRTAVTMIDAPNERRVVHDRLHTFLLDEAVDADSVADAADIVVRRTYFLLHRANDVDPTSFVGDVLPRFLRRLDVDSEHELLDSSGRVEGRIDWSKTMKARSAAGGDNSRFVSRAVRRRVDNPANQLVRFVAEEIVECCRAVPQLLLAGSCLVGERFGGNDVPIGEHVSWIELEMERHLAHRRFRDVRRPSFVDGLALDGAERSRNHDHALAAVLYRRWHAAIVESGSQGVAACGRRALPLPPTLDGDGERWVRLAAAAIRG